MKNNCCYNCKDRQIGCHSICERYKEYRMNLDEIKNKKEEIFLWVRYSQEKFIRTRKERQTQVYATKRNFLI